jgi:ligand-binding sensor domain-containing protein
MKRTLTIIPVFLCMVYGQIFAQVFTHNWSALDYSFVRSIAFDKEGNTWYGTYAAGVLKYNGSEWTSFTMEDGLSSDFTSNIACDAEGNIWVGTRGGISKYNGSEWTSFTIINGVNSVGGVIVDYILDPDVYYTIEADDFGNVYCGLEFDFLKFDGSDWQYIWSVYPSKDDLFKADTDSSYWLGGDYGATYYNGRGWKSYGSEEGLVNNNVNVIEIDQEGNVWFGTEGGVSKFDGTAWTSYTEADGLASNNVENIAIGSEGNIWCTSQSTVTVYNGLTWTIHEIIDEVIPWGHIFSIAAADNGSVLLGTYNGNLSNRFIKYDGSGWITYTYDECVAGFVYTIAEDNNGNKWFGTSQGLSKLEGGKWHTYTERDGLADNWVNDILFDTDGSIWCGTFGGVSVFDGAAWTNYTTKEGLVSDTIGSIALDAEGNIWAGTDKGVSVFEGTSWTSYTTEDGLAGDLVKAIETDPVGNVWIGTNDGLRKYDGSIWSTYRIEDGLAHNVVNAIAFDTSGNVWCGTGNGVSSFDGGEWTILGEGNISQISFDSGNSLWMVTATEWGNPEGIAKFDGTNFTVYSRHDGLFVWDDIFIDSGDTLWIGSGAFFDGFYEYGGFSKMNLKTDFTAPKAKILYYKSDIRYGDTLVITATFDEPMLYSSGVLLTLDGAVKLSETPMVRENDTTYSYNYPVPNKGGEVRVSLSGGRDLWGNELESTPVSGEVFSITPVTFGDVDDDGSILAFDAALVQMRSLNDFINLYFHNSANPWVYWQDIAANVDGVEGITISDAEMILQYSTESITSFTAGNKKSSLPAGVNVDVQDNHVVFYSSGYLIGLNIEVLGAHWCLGTPELIYDGFLSSFNIDDDNYRIGIICKPFALDNGTLIMKIPIAGEEQVTFHLRPNTGMIYQNLDLVLEPSTTISQAELANLMVYPNPVDDMLKIQGLRKPGILRIFSTAGHLMLTEVLNADHTEIDVSALPGGMYILNLETDDGSIVKKISVN